MMRRGGPNVNLAIYGQAFVHLVRHPSIVLLPLAAAAIGLFVWYWETLFTDPLGGFGAGLFQLAVQIVYLFAFGGAVIQANNIARGYRATFSDAWDETRRKSGGILIAAIGFQFVTWIAQYIGQFLGITVLSIALQLIAYFFLILTIPAAAIGGLPGGLALSGSIRAVRANWPACVLLAIVFIVLWVVIPQYLLLPVLEPYSVYVQKIVLAVYNAIALAYLAFPFAVTYDETAFRGYY
jgi:hypothetical protein